MEIKQVTDETIWTEFFNDCGSPSFHHSWSWGEFQKKQDHPIMRLGIYAKNRLEGIALVIKNKARRGSFLFIPHGPIIKTSEPKLIAQYSGSLMTYLKKIAVTEKFSFIRIAPILHDTPENRQLYKKMGLQQAPIYIHAERMWALDITKSEDELLAGMRKTTRYLIRKAIKDGITIEKKNTNSIKLFWNIYQETFSRERFSPYSQKYIDDEFQSFHSGNNAVYFFGKSPAKFAQEGLSTPDTSSKRPPYKKPHYLAGALILFTHSTAFYHQGASVHTKLPVPYLLQWEAIKEAKKRGCRVYNFYGILQEGRTPKAWEGLTQFKKGFGGYQVDYLPTHDYIISPQYYLSWLYEKYLNFRRGV